MAITTLSELSEALVTQGHRKFPFVTSETLPQEIEKFSFQVTWRFVENGESCFVDDLAAQDGQDAIQILGCIGKAWSIYVYACPNCTSIANWTISLFDWNEDKQEMEEHLVLNLPVFPHR